MTTVAWPDVVIAVVVLFGLLKGFKRGLVRELTGAVALAFGVAAAFRYPGMWDEFLATHVRVAAGATHVVGMVAYAAVAYAIVLALGSVLSLAAKLPLLGIGNALGGAVVGAGKALVLMWAILYVALFFPLSAPIRDDLHRSSLVAVLERPNDSFDSTLRGRLPPFIAPFASSLFANHRV